MGKFILRFLFISVPLLLIVIAVNYWGDAAQLFSKKYLKSMVSIISNGKYVTGVSNYDERLFNKAYAEDCKTRYDVLIIGSSRTMLINSDNFPGQKVFNCSVSGASIEDLVAIYQIYKERNLLPKKILFGIDPWIFNKNSGQSRWSSVRKDYTDFFKGKKLLEVNPGVRDRKYLQLISPSYFQVSVKNLPGVISGEAMPKATLNKFNTGSTKLTDGSLVYAEAFRNSSAAEVEKQVKDYLKGDIYSLEHYDSLSGSAEAVFNMLMDDCKKNHVDVAFILQPYHPEVYRSIKITHPIILTADAHIRQVAATRAIKIFGDYDPAGAGLNTSDFYDGMHDKQAAIVKIFNRDSWFNVR